MPSSRREFLWSTSATALHTRQQPARQLKIVVTGSHPGDPECGCAGTVARYTALGHDVCMLYLNRGEGFCKGEIDSGRCGAIRTAEAQNACKILKASPVFAGQLDGRAVVDNAQYAEFYRILQSVAADVIFAQWPIDQHRDHRAVSLLAFDAWFKAGRKSGFYYYEVAGDTQMFSPSEYVDISAPKIERVRRAACYAHASQQPDRWYPQQVELTRFRGSQSGHSQSEAFLRHWQSPRAFLPA